MATYDINSLPAKFKTGDIINCPYSGTIKSITLPKGQFKFECWGGNGYTAEPTQSIGGNGGYSVGEYTLTNSQTLYLVSGGAGTQASTFGSGGGYNGGGNGCSYSSYYGGGGGGATHIATISSLLSARSSDYTTTVLIIAGGGGGTGYSSSLGRYESNGGNGGGESGSDGTSSSDPKYRGTGGTQTTAGKAAEYPYCEGSFGQGGSNRTTGSAYFVGGGGGGLYGGGGGYRYGSAGGGGSGYINPSLLTNASTIQESTSTNPDTTGNGYIRITIIKVASASLPVNIGGTWKETDSAYVNIGGAWKEIDSIYVNINGAWKETS